MWFPKEMDAIPQIELKKAVEKEEETWQKGNDHCTDEFASRA